MTTEQEIQYGMQLGRMIDKIFPAAMPNTATDRLRYLLARAECYLPCACSCCGHNANGDCPACQLAAEIKAELKGWKP